MAPSWDSRLSSWKIGQSLGGKAQPASSNAEQLSWLTDLPLGQDLIIPFEKVAEKAQRTTQLLNSLARNEAAFNPPELRAFIAWTFTRVQKCWEARDYGPVREFLDPSLLAQHEGMLRIMSRDRVINRLQNLRMLRLEFVHLCCPADANSDEVTALVTFEARAYWCNDRDGAFLHGSRSLIPYQEYWVFRRCGNRWRLASIERSHESTRLETVNCVDRMTEVERRNAEDGVIAL